MHKILEKEIGPFLKGGFAFTILGRDHIVRLKRGSGYIASKLFITP